MAYVTTYIPSFDFSTLANGESAYWDNETQKWVVYTMKTPQVENNIPMPSEPIKT